jgi:hypothetical protein
MLYYTIPVRCKRSPQIEQHFRGFNVIGIGHWWVQIAGEHQQELIAVGNT